MSQGEAGSQGRHKEYRRLHQGHDGATVGRHCCKLLPKTTKLLPSKLQQLPVKALTFMEALDGEKNTASAD